MIIFTIQLGAQVVIDCTDLFISEYVEGSSQNKALEIYNPTNAIIDLSDYQLERYRDGETSSAAGGVLQLNGTIPPGDVWVVTHGDTDQTAQFGFIDITLYNMGDQNVSVYPSPLHMNGDDAIVLSKISNGQILDVIGRVGEDPGIAWTDDASAGYTDANGGAWWTANHTLIRKPTIKIGDSDGLNLFNPALEWDSLPTNTWGNLGTHNSNCFTTKIQEKDNKEFTVYPNPIKKGGNLVVISKENVKKVEIYDLLGKKEKSIFPEENNSIISTSSMKKGIYFIRLYFEDGRIFDNKFIVE
tara:strand:+ start:121 stop:1020 length:900 start_codon:yes stop_codon:yes gene_type:complete